MEPSRIVRGAPCAVRQAATAISSTARRGRQGRRFDDGMGAEARRGGAHPADAPVARRGPKKNQPKAARSTIAPMTTTMSALLMTDVLLAGPPFQTRARVPPPGRDRAALPSRSGTSDPGIEAKRRR